MSNENEKLLDLYYGEQENLPALEELQEGSLYFTDKGRLYDGNSKKLIGEDLDKLNIGSDNTDIDESSIIHGDHNICGVRGFYIYSSFDYNSIPDDWETLPIQVSTVQPEGHPNGYNGNVETIEGYFEAGDNVNICWGKKWWDIIVDTVDTDTNTIYLDRNTQSEALLGYLKSAEYQKYLEDVSEAIASGKTLAKDAFSIYTKSYAVDGGVVSLKEHTNAYGYGNEAQGNYSSAFGLRNKAYGDYSFVQGRDSEGRYNNFVAGSGCKGFKDSCFVQGYQNEAHGDISFAAGWGNRVYGRTGAVTGKDNTAEGESSFVTGQNNTTTITDDATFVSGYNNKVFTTGSSIVAGKDNNVGTSNTASNLSIVLGQGNTLTGYHADGDFGGTVVLGHQHTVDASKSFSIVAGGRNNKVSNYYASVLGGNVNEARGWYSTVVGGTYGTASGKASAILGGGDSSTQKNTVSGERSAIIAGKDNLVSGNEAFATGTGVTVSGASAAAFGTKGSVYGYNAFIAGNSTNKASDKVSNLNASGMNITIDTTFASDKTFHIVYGGSSASIGYDNCITADYSYTLGQQNHIQTGSTHSIAIGQNNTIKSTHAFIAGKDNSHSNTDSAYSAIFGESNEIKNAKYSLTFGFDCSNNSYYGVVGGYKSSNSGSNYSIAFGNSCKANGGEGSVALGNQTITSNKYQVAIGRFNDNTKNTDALFVIGDGTTNSARKNLFVVQPTAATMNGSFNVTGATTTASLKVEGTSEHGNITANSATFANKITIGSTQLTEDQLQKIVSLIDTIED